MTTIIPTPAPVPDPLSSDFGTKAYDFTVWMAAAAPAMTAVAQETNDALNQSLLGMVSTTTSSITIAAPGGTVNFTTQANKGYAIGMTLKIASTANPANYVKVRLTAYNISTGVSAGTIISNGGSGTFASWSVFFDVPDPTVLSVPTGEAVAAGNLLAIDDAGNSMSAGSITTAVLQAVTATSMHACPLANGNTAIFWTAGSTDYRMMIINKSGGTVLDSTSVTTGQNSGLVWSAELTNGNIAIVYFQITTGYPVFKIVSQSGVPVVAETVIEAVAGVGQIKCCALTTGGFAVTYNTAANNRFATYFNDGTPNRVPTINVSGAQTRVAICPTASGGFIALAGTNSLIGNIYYGLGGVVNTSCGINAPMTSGFGDVNISSISGTVAATGRYSGAIPSGPTINLASDASSNVINSYGTTSADNSILHVPFSDLYGVTNTALGSGHIAALGNGNFMATFSSVASSGSNEYPRYVIFNGIGQVMWSGVLFSELAKQGTNTPILVIPKDTNGYSLIWLAANQNIKFAQVKSGKVVGVSLGAVGSTHQYLSAGEVTVANTNILNVGDSKINYSRRGAKVVI